MKQYSIYRFLLIATIILVSTAWLPEIVYASFTVSPQSVLFKMRHKQKITLVDVRNRQEFAKVKIPGSINIPVYAIKTKPFLKNRSLVLINGGYPDKQMEKECRQLHRSNFKVSILRGGLLAWYKAKGRIEGDLLLLKQYRHISPAQFYHEKERNNQVIIDASKLRNPESKNLIPKAKHIPFSNNPSKMNFLLSGLSTESKKKLNLSELCGSACPMKFMSMRSGANFIGAVNNKMTFILVFNNNGDNYEPINRILNKAGCKNVFYLKGGLNDYRTYLNNRVLAGRSKQSRTRSVTRCRNCGREK